MRAVFAAVVLPLVFAACLPGPKISCGTTDDCAPGRVCVVGTCQPAIPDAGPDTRFKSESSGDVAIERSERPGTDDADVALDLAPPVDGALSDQSVPWIDAPVVSTGMDAGLDEIPSERPSPDFANVAEVGPDSTSMPVDTALDVSTVLAIDAPADWQLSRNGIEAGDALLGDAGGLSPAPVSWEDFRAQSPREPWPGGRYIVDGDLALDVVGLRAYYDAWIAAAGATPATLAPMGFTVTWPFPACLSLSYCISSLFGDNLPVIEAAMQIATASWSDSVAVGYAYLPEENASCDAGNATVTFDVRPVSGAGYSAVSFFPDSPRSARSLLIDSSALAVGPDGVDLEGTLRHQLGHTLGFRHENLWLDPACTSEDGRLAVQVANYDVDSVMHLPTCRPSEIGGTVPTEGDLAGAIALYGLSPVLISVSGMTQ